MPIQGRFLLIDQGNSRLKCRITDANGVILEERSIQNPDFAPAWFSNLPVPDCVVLLNSGELLFKPEEIWPGAQIHYFNAADAEGIQWAYADVRQMGRDRMAALLGAQSEFPEQNLIVADAGTCLTIDYLRKDGLHLGGFISPGVQMRFRALNSFTHRLPLVDNDLSITNPGTSTEECIRAGVSGGLLAELNFHFSGFYFGLDEPFFCLLSGGDAKDLAHHLKQSTFVAPDLIFKGLFRVCRRLS